VKGIKKGIQKCIRMGGCVSVLKKKLNSFFWNMMESLDETVRTSPTP
jgi:hypothetical protein